MSSNFTLGSLLHVVCYTHEGSPYNVCSLLLVVVLIVYGGTYVAVSLYSVETGSVYLPPRSLTHILHVPNYNERTTVFKVETDVDFVSGESTVSIGGGDVIDYPLSVLPRRQGVFSGAVAFVAQAISRPHRCARGGPLCIREILLCT